MSNRTRYRVYDTLVDSAIPLPLPPTCDDTPPRLYVDIVRAEDSSDAAGPFLINQDPASVPHLIRSVPVGLSGGAGRSPLLMVSDDATKLTCVTSGSGCDPVALQDVICYQMLPRMLSQQGHPILHASAAQIDGSAVCMLGASGVGKSTIAAALWRKGWQHVADDTLLLHCRRHAVYGVPAWSPARLNADSACALGIAEAATTSDGSKLRLSLTPPDAQATPVRLDAILALKPRNPCSRAGDSEPVELRALGKATALMVLMNYAFRLDPLDRKCLVAHMSALASCVNQGVPVYELSYVKAFSNLDRLRAAVTSMLFP